MKPNKLFAQMAIAALFVAPASLATDFTLTWHTIDGGGGYSAGGNFELEGTIGQHDAGPVGDPMIGGGFELTGGFWPVTQICYCPGDMNSDGMKDGADIQLFVACVLSGGNCSCADMDVANGVNFADVPVFVNILLVVPTCP